MAADLAEDGPPATASAPQDDPFAPPDVHWRAPSPRFVVARRAVSVPVWGVLVLVCVGAGAALGPRTPPGLVAWGLAAVLVALACWHWWFLGAQCRSWTYAERDDDLLVRRGVVMRRLTVVPYGRMQFVDVWSGPVDRLFGLAQVQLHTASAVSDAVVQGLEAHEAARLRDRLSALGEVRRAGL